MPKEAPPYKFHYLLHSADLVQDLLRVQLAPFEVSPHQARVIKTLDRLGPVSQIDLAREIGITAASMSTMTARLIALDLIRIEKDPSDAKRNVIILTGKGNALLRKIDRVWANVDALLKEKLGAKNFGLLAELTRTLRDSLDGHAPGDK